MTQETKESKREYAERMRTAYNEFRDEASKANSGDGAELIKALDSSTTVDEVLSVCEQWFYHQDDDFIEAVEALDDWNGWLGDDRRYEMYEIGDCLGHLTITEFVDILDSNFDKDEEYFYIDSWGEICSTDYKDYNDYLDRYFVETFLTDYPSLDLETDVYGAMFTRYEYVKALQEVDE